MKILVILLLLCSTAYAEPNLLLAGKRYVLLPDSDKTKLVTSLYTILKVDRNVHTVERGIIALDNFYYIFYEEIDTDPKMEEANKIQLLRKVFDKPVMEVLSEILSMSPPTSYDEEMLKKYGLTVKK